MGDKTNISWTDATWNPVRGCSIVSKGCANCYAMTLAARYSGIDKNGKKQPYYGLARLSKSGKPVWTGRTLFVEHLLDQPLRWRKPRRIFVNSMSDLFHETVTDEQLDRIFSVMEAATWHVFQILTKRPERMRDYLRNRWMIDDPLGGGLIFPWMYDVERRPPPHIWLGVSVEDEDVASRIPVLLQTPAAIRMLSLEPLLGPINLERYLWAHDGDGRRHGGPYGGIHWVIVGGESGPGFRPMDCEWARSIMGQCAEAGVAFWFKQTSARLSGQGADALGRLYQEFPDDAVFARRNGGRQWEQTLATTLI